MSRQDKFKIAPGRGSDLIRVILEKIELEGLDIKEVAPNCFDISVVYFDAMKAGRRYAYRLDEEKLEKIAQWLGISKGQVYILAGILEAKDFYAYDDLSERLNRIYREISNDPVWMGLAPGVDEWDAASLRMRLMMVHLYEQMTMRNLLERAKAG